MAKKITKRQRKAMNSPNAAKLGSLANGTKYQVAGTTYIGENPVFEKVNNRWVKILKGVPWVRV